MRPDLLNPLFAEVRALKGVGPALIKPLARLGLERIKDLLYHFPTGWVYRKRVTELDVADVGQNVIVTLIVIDHKSNSSPRAPTRIHANDPVGNYVTLTFFGRNGGWARKQLPTGATRIVSGKLERYGDELQIVHPDVSEVGPNNHLDVLAEPVYPLSEGINSRRIALLADANLADLPQLPEWIEPGLLVQKKWPGWSQALQLAHRSEQQDARDRLAYDELFSNQLAMRLVRAAMDRRLGTAIVGDGRLIGALQLPFALTNAQKRAISEIDGDLAQSKPMLRLLQGDVGSGKTMVALHTLLRAVEAGKQGAFLAPTEILARQHFANLQHLLAGLPQREIARSNAYGIGRWLHRHIGRHPRNFSRSGKLPCTRGCGYRRAAPVWREPKADVVAQGQYGPASIGYDRDPDPAHFGARKLWRNGWFKAGRVTSWPNPGRDQRHVVGTTARIGGWCGAPFGKRTTGILGLPIGRRKRE
jgi:ATP-dependent DNA helicase RecG